VLVKQLADAAALAGGLAAKMEVAKIAAERDQKRASNKLEELQIAAIRNDAETFSRIAVSWHTVMSRLAQFRLTTMARTPIAGDFVVRNKGAAKVQTAITNTTAGLVSKADAIDSDRDPDFVVPMWHYKSNRSRVAENPGGAASHAWWLAAALDCLSALGLALVMVMMWKGRDDDDRGGPPHPYPIPSWPSLPPPYAPQTPWWPPYYSGSGSLPPPR
jgi:hypothetical protein